MARKRTGLRNRWRTGLGTYSRFKKARVADHYGAFTGRYCEDIIAGRAIRYEAVGRVVIDR